MAAVQEAARPQGPPADVAVLFVHGIGDQVQGDTLQSFSGPLLATLAQLPGSEAVLGPVDPVEEPPELGEPLRVTLRRTAGGGEQTTATWLLSEAWWAKSFSAPSYGQLVRWLLLAGPQTMYRHALRYLIVPRPARQLSALTTTVLNNPYGLIYIRLPLLVWRRVLYPIVMVSTALVLQVLFLLLVPLAAVPLLRRGIQRIQYLLVATVGDSLAFVAVPESFDRMVNRVRDELSSLESRASRIIVVAHSQGAAVAHEALRHDPCPSGKITSFVTLGAGLDKLSVLRQNKDAGLLDTLSGIGALWAMPPAAGLVLLGTQDIPEATADVIGPIVGVLFCTAAVAGALLPLRRYRRLQQSIDAGLPLPRQGDRMEWVDIYASADPVPHGPLLRVTSRPWLLDPRRANVASVEVQNYKSLVRDHTTYQKNVEQVLLPLLDRICAATPIRPTRATGDRDYERLVERGWSWREQRTRWRARTRLSTVLALWILITPPANTLAHPLLLVAAQLCLHALATGPVWGLWDEDESRRLLRHRPTRSTLRMAVFLLTAALPYAALTAAHLWITGDTGMAVFCGVLFALLWLPDLPSMLRRRARMPVVVDDTNSGPNSL
ncbi:hypothetical protein [Streptomyces sp. Je 1-332]|uniref:hypothetical protein n=1 Tax=Streptomyces sp. Je 1-332 TaxID=3231270 RepID=UPI003458DAA7